MRKPAAMQTRSAMQVGGCLSLGKLSSPLWLIPPLNAYIPSVLAYTVLPVPSTAGSTMLFSFGSLTLPNFLVKQFHGTIINYSKSISQHCLSLCLHQFKLEPSMKNCLEKKIQISKISKLFTLDSQTGALSRTIIFLQPPEKLWLGATSKALVGIPLLWEKAERTGIVQYGKEKPLG